MQVTLNQNGFYFFNNDGKFVNPQLNIKNYHVKGFQLANSLIRIKESLHYYSIHLMKINDAKTNNEEWKRNNPYLYLNPELKLSNAGIKSYPSAIDNKFCRLYMINSEICSDFVLQAYRTGSIYINKQSIMSRVLLFKEQYQKGAETSFIEEFGQDRFQIPTIDDAIEKKSSSTEKKINL